MIAVTGGAGMIGSNIVHALNTEGRADIFVVDDLTDGTKFRNIAAASIADYLDKDDFMASIRRGEDFGFEVMFHHGACSTTTEWDGRLMIRSNFEYSKLLLHYCLERRIPFIYASSAAVYSGSCAFREDPRVELPLSVYGYSKKLFDDYVRRHEVGAESPIVGLRYFNVYGPREHHKREMASVVLQLHNQIARGGNLQIFGAFDGFGPGEQRRDFIHVDDAVAVTLWCWHTGVSGIFNCGTGCSWSFQELAEAVIAAHGRGEIEYVAFPDHLKAQYQSFTEADISRLRGAGYNGSFKDVARGVLEYVEWLKLQPRWS